MALKLRVQEVNEQVNSNGQTITKVVVSNGLGMSPYLIATLCAIAMVYVVVLFVTNCRKNETKDDDSEVGYYDEENYQTYFTSQTESEVSYTDYEKSSLYSECNENRCTANTMSNSSLGCYANKKHISQKMYHQR